MARRRNDYRMTRQGKGVNIDKKNEKVVISLNIACPFCNEQTQHDKVIRFIHSKQAYFLRCRTCGRGRFDEFVDRSGYKSPESKKGRLLQSFQEYLWDWVRDEIEGVVALEFPEKINLFTGKRGNPRRHKGKSIYSSSDLHPDFLRYLDTPEYIKRLNQALRNLESNDPELFDYFFFRAAGYSFSQIQDIGHFGKAIVKPTNSARKHRGEYEPTEYCRILNKKVSRFLLESIPEDLLKTFPSGEKAIAEVLDEESSRRGDTERHDRVTCPKCGATNPDCTLCRARKRQWDGTIPRWLSDSYQKKLAEGIAWD